MFPFTKLKRKINKLRDLSQDTCEKSNIALIRNSFFNIQELDYSRLDLISLEYLSDMYFEHRFDLLGSGWEKNTYASHAPGLENYKYDHNLLISDFDKYGNWLNVVVRSEHLEKSKKIWENIIGDYVPIDWQKDIKSGFRWNAAIWYKDQRNKYYPGADLKVPWEIARLYHLPQLAVYAFQSKDRRDQIIREFHNQIIDFIATNPPRMGVNWTTTMEVSIRAVNMLIAYDFFRQIDQNAILNKAFDQLFSNSIYEHGKHIFQNLEYRKSLTSNHYLSNLTGLLFISSYLPENNETIRWYSFSINELMKEIWKQFLPDGGNFESSLNYHMLSSQFIILSVSIMAAIGKENYLDRAVQDMIFKIGIFAKSFIKSNGEIPQIGDNDSGRLIKLSPAGEFISLSKIKEKYMHLKNNYLNGDIFWDENILNHSPTLAYFDGLMESQEFNEYGNQFPLEKSFINCLAKGHKLKSNSYPYITEYSSVKNNIESEYFYHQRFEIESEIKNEISLTKNLTTLVFPYSMIIIFKSDRLYLIINAMSNGQNGYGGHAHNDKLSFELNIDGIDLIVDPGTYLYTALPERRNLFRSVKYHNTLVVEGEEQNHWKDGISGLFQLKNESFCQILEIKNNSAAIKLNYRDIEQIRKFEITDTQLIINDYSNKPFKTYFNRHNIYSNGYGKLISLNLLND